MKKLKKLYEHKYYFISFPDQGKCGIVENKDLEFLSHFQVSTVRCTHTGGQKPVVANLKWHIDNNLKFGYDRPALTASECVPIEFDIDVVI